MSLRDSLNALDKRYAWSLLGFFLAAVLGALTIYTGFIRDSGPDLRFELTSSTSVLDVREELGKLDIFYDGIDITRSEQSLRVAVVRSINLGTDDILIGHYDVTAPLGFSVSGGKLLRVDLLDSSNGYLQSKLKVSVRDSSEATFAPVILESGEFFIFKALILHSNDSMPEIVPFGKIAGIKEISIYELSPSEEQKSFWERTFAGDIWIQAARLIPYTVGLFLVLIGIIFPVVSISDWLTKRKRRANVTRFKSIAKEKLEDKDRFLFDRYEASGAAYIHKLAAFIEDDESFRHAMETYTEEYIDESFRHATETYTEEYIDESEQLFTPPAEPIQTFPFSPGTIVNRLKKEGVVTKNDQVWELDPKTACTIKEFSYFLAILGEDMQKFTHGLVHQRRLSRAKKYD